jgi:hypothetical protein
VETDVTLYCGRRQIDIMCLLPVKLCLAFRVAEETLHEPATLRFVLQNEEIDEWCTHVIYTLLWYMSVIYRLLWCVLILCKLLYCVFVQVLAPPHVNMGQHGHYIHSHRLAADM